MMIDRTVLLLNLRYWTLHVGLNAAPSVLIALDMVPSPPWARAGAMGCGIACFIVGYAVVSSTNVFQNRIRPSDFGRALKWATWIRSGVAVGALLGLGVVGGAGWTWARSLFLPFVMVEMYAGFLALGMVETIGRWPWVRQLRVALTSPGAEERAASPWLGGMNSIIPTFLTTVVEGVVLSLLLLVIALGITAVMAVGRRVGRRWRS